MSISKWWLVLPGLCPVLAFAAESGEHTDPIASVILSVTTIFFFAILGRYIARRFNQPGVLGELLMGVLVGNLCYFFGSQLIIILREGSSIFNIMKEVLVGHSLSQAVATAIPNPFYAQQVTQALSAPEGTVYLKIAYTVDVFLKIIGPRIKVPAKKSNELITIRITTQKSTAPLITILLTTANMIKPNISSSIAAPRIVLASLVRSFFISDNTRAVIPILVALKVAAINKSA